MMTAHHCPNCHEEILIAPSDETVLCLSCYSAFRIYHNPEPVDGQWRDGPVLVPIQSPTSEK
jgi:hypothetical protein